jgi:hypothetical protein
VKATWPETARGGLASAPKGLRWRTAAAQLCHRRWGYGKGLARVRGRERG